MSAFYKCLSGLSLFASIPLLLSYLGNDVYGTWVLIFTLFQWILLLDFGLASVLKTKIPELQHSGDSSLINVYIAATYKKCIWLSIIIFISFSLIVYFFNIKTLLNIPFSSIFTVKLFILNILFFCINFVLNTHKSLFVSVYKGKYAEQSIALNQIVFLLAILIPLFCFKSISLENKLYIVSFINGIVCTCVNLIYTIYFFKTEPYKLFIPLKSLSYNFKGSGNLGLKYMLLQVGTLFLFTCDSYILSYFFGPQSVVPYEVVSKYFQFPLMILTAGMAPLWSLFTKNYLSKDYQWLKSGFKKFNYAFILILAGIVLCVVIAKPIMKLWISPDFDVPYFLIIPISTLISLRIFLTFYGYFFSGIGNLKSSIWLLTLSLLLKIPLSCIFIKMGYGIVSVVLATVCCISIWCVILPVQAYKIVNKLRAVS